MRRSVRRNAAPAALVLSMVALVSSFTGAADAAREALTRVVSKPRPNAVLKLGKNGKFPAKALPKVAAAKTADLLGELSAEDVKLHCNTESIDLGTWCMASSVFSVPPEDAGKNNFFYATQKCTELGGFLPSASQLIGAATRVKLQSYYTDSQLTASTDIDPADGLTDRREMSSTLITTQGGPSAAGLLGVSEGSRGNPRTGEPNPVVVPAVPAPDTLQYVTVVDNGERGGFAGSKPVGQSESFRCGFYKQQGEPELEEK
ncbi:MAG: hypothetical protein JHD16_09840 [Solirubrobacteraceae bacterium]|nr:hypothetical protein [Solirubrobacteraceae bacterium]